MADVRTLAITDHHQVEPYAEVVELAASLGVALIPAVELDCLAGERRVDLLGYWIDPAAPSLTQFLARWPGGAQQMLADRATLSALGALVGLDLTPERLQAASGKRPPGLADLFTTLVRAGVAPTIGAAFRQWEELRLAGKLPRSARRYAPVQDGAAAIRAAGGVVTLAHPGLVRDDATVRRLLAAGVVDAIETPYAGYWHDGAARNALYRALADEFSLPTSAGSDYHAYPFSDVKLGMDVPAGTLARLRAAG